MLQLAKGEGNELKIKIDAHNIKLEGRWKHQKI